MMTGAVFQAVIGGLFKPHVHALFFLRHCGLFKPYVRIAFRDRWALTVD
jgi:hypothetical protein